MSVVRVSLEPAGGQQTSVSCRHFPCYKQFSRDPVKRPHLASLARVSLSVALLAVWSNRHLCGQTPSQTPLQSAFLSFQLKSLWRKPSVPGGIHACRLSNNLKQVEHPQSIPVHHGHILACDLELSKAQNVNEDIQTRQRWPQASFVRGGHCSGNHSHFTSSSSSFSLRSPGWPGMNKAPLPLQTEYWV